ncbi:MAG: motility protein A [Bdellovibrionales bacterium]
MRMFSTIIGALLAGVIIAMTFLTSGVDVKFFVNYLGFAIVIGGTTSAIFLSYEITDVIRVLNVISKIFMRKGKSLHSIGNELMKFSERCSNSGIPTNSGGVAHPFLNDCLVLMSDGYDDEEMREMLEQRIITHFENEKHDVGIIKSMSKYPPAFGMVGTVVGLIALMSSMGGETADMAKIGTYMAVALTTTLYGLMIANFIFGPISDNLEVGAEKNLKIRQLVMETALLIHNDTSLLVIQDNVNSFMPPRGLVDYVGGTGAKSAA